MSQVQPTMGRRSVLAAGAGIAATTALPGAASAQPDDLESWLSDANNYDGIQDATGQDEVTVEVGAGENGLAFGPAAVRVDPGTTVRWEWPGEGGTHNVAATDGAFRSGDAVSGSDVTFEHTFESDGEYRYVCEPHETVGMLGAVVVGDAGAGSGGGGGGGGGRGGGGGTDDGTIGSSTFAAVTGVLLVPLLFALALLGKELVGDDEEERSAGWSHR
jgi:halocyanin-like protein